MHAGIGGDPGSEYVRVGVVSDKPMLADGLASLLDAEPGVATVVSSGDLELSLGLLEDGKLEVLVVEKSTLDTAARARAAATLRRRPEAGVVVVGTVLPPLGAPAARWRSADDRRGVAGVLDALRLLWEAAGPEA